ncbi:MAG: discoidin domain-containing protein, partial [Candidatus Nitrosocosmicus sp.]
KRDFLILLWVIPYLALVYAVGVITHFHWALVLPAFCIAGAIMIEDLSNRAARIMKKRRLQNVVPFAITCGIAVFGIAATSMLVTANLSSEQIKVAAFVTNFMKNNNNTDTTLISNSALSWIPKYVFHQGDVFPDYLYGYSSPGVKTEKVIFVADDGITDYIDSAGESEKEKIAGIPNTVIDDDLESFWKPSESSNSLLLDLGNSTSICGINIAWLDEEEEEEEVNSTGLLGFFGAEEGDAPEGLTNFTAYSSEDGKSFDEIYSQDINDSSTLPQKYDFKDAHARYLKITTNGNFNESSTGISEISVYGQQIAASNSPDSSCKNLEISKVIAINSDGTISANPVFAGYVKEEDRSSYSARLSVLFDNSKIIKQFNEISADDNKTYPFADADSPVEVRLY